MRLFIQSVISYESKESFINYNRKTKIYAKVRILPPPYKKKEKYLDL